MILPSDGDPPHRRRDDDKDDKVPSQEPDNEAWWEAEDASADDGEDCPDDADGGEDEDGDDDDDDFEDALDDPHGVAGIPPYAPEDKIILKSTAGPGWREELVRELVDSISDLREIEDPDDEYDPPEPPDLYTFFGELAALRNEMRRNGRRAGDAAARTSEAFDNVQGLLKNLAPSPAAGKEKAGIKGGTSAPWPVDTCLALVALHDLLAKALTGSAAADASLGILLNAAGISRIAAAAGQAFDAATMTIAEVEPAAPASASAGAGESGTGSPQTVIRETEAGFLRAGQLLRPARVVVGSGPSGAGE
jgi:hypothetical protein